MEQPQTHSLQVSQAADLAVSKVFALLGVDVNNAESVESFRQDLRFGGLLRKLANQGLIGFVGLGVAGIAAAFWLGVMSILRGK